MKKAILIATLVLALAQATAVAHAGAAAPLTILLAGGSEDNTIAISLSADGRSYVIDSVVPLEVGGDVCSHPPEMANELICSAAAIGGFEVNAGAGDDAVWLTPEVPAPVTLRGGPGNDRLVGGSGADKLIGGPGDDVLIGRAGADSIFGGSGKDRLQGGAGNDLLNGGSDEDTLFGGAGRNILVQ